MRVPLLVVAVALAAIVGDAARPVTYVDTSLRDSQKYVLFVDDAPFHMTSIQLRADKLRYVWNWSAPEIEAVFAQVASDGFRVVSIPLQWVEVEAAKGVFDWTTLDLYLSWVLRFGLRFELLWFGANSGGRVEWLGWGDTPLHLRTPDYVLWSTSPASNATTSDYHLVEPYTLDYGDARFLARECFVLGEVLSHVAQWDAAHGSTHPLIGVQLNNEAMGPFSDPAKLGYLSALGRAVKVSAYGAVWTRLNDIHGQERGQILVNEDMRVGKGGTGIDFIGVDLYRMTPEGVQTELLYAGANFRMVCENGASTSDAAFQRLAALAGNAAHSMYDAICADNDGLYVPSDPTTHRGFVPRGAYIQDVRAVNAILNSDMVDVALNAHGYGLFVHNWRGNDTTPSTGVDGVAFAPAHPLSAGVSIHRSANEVVLMSTRGGVFSFPPSLGVTAVTAGTFNGSNHWVESAAVTFTDTSVVCAPVTTLRMVTSGTESPPPVREQAEFARLGGGAVVSSKSLGFAGNGYVGFPITAGGWAEFTGVDGLAGGARTLRIRYAWGFSNVTAGARVVINGSPLPVSFAPTGAWDRFALVSLPVQLEPGPVNTVRLEGTGEGVGNTDEIQVL